MLDSAKLAYNLLIFDNLYANETLSTSGSVFFADEVPNHVLTEIANKVTTNAYKSVFETLYRFADYF